MKSLALWVLLFGCGTSSPAALQIETGHCTQDLTSSAGYGCRMYWSGGPDDILTIELVGPQTSGSFAAPHMDWMLFAAHAPAGQLSDKLSANPYPTTTGLPTSIDGGTMLMRYSRFSCGDLGLGHQQLDHVTVDVNDNHASISMSFPAMTCFRSGGEDMYPAVTYTFAGDGGAAIDPNAVVTIP